MESVVKEHLNNICILFAQSNISKLYAEGSEHFVDYNPPINFQVILLVS